jgi:glycosyltransferase involved in cell wall biosynthesis
MATVSVIIPLYNPRPDYLDEALAGVASQSGAEVEAVVVNDGSTDRSFEPVLERHSAIVRLVEQENSGVASARNAGISAARGDCVAFLDQDDRWHTTKLEKQIAVMERDPSVDVVFHPVNYIDENGAIRKKNSAKERLLKQRRLSKDVLRALLEGNFIFSPTVLVKRSCFKTTGGFDPAVDPHDDWDMWLRLALAGFKFAGIEEPLADWRIHPGNTSRDSDRMLFTRLGVLNKLEKNGLLPERLGPALRLARAKCHATLAHHHYRAGLHAAYRREIKTAASIDWRAVAKIKMLRRWCRGVILERMGR